MFIIYLNVNFDTVKKFRCVRIKGEPHQMCTYQLDDGTIIKHHYDDGAEALAIKMLKHYRRKGRKKTVVPDWAKSNRLKSSSTGLSWAEDH